MEQGVIIVIGAVQARDKKAVAELKSSQAPNPGRRAEAITVLQL